MNRSAFVLVLCFAAVYPQTAIPTALQEILEKLAVKCIVESGADPALVAKLETGEAIDDKKLKCFVKCFMVEIGGMDDDGTVHLASMKEFFPPGQMQDDVMEMAEKCKDEKGADACETAYAIHMCGMALMADDEDR